MNLMNILKKNIIGIIFMNNRIILLLKNYII